MNKYVNTLLIVVVLFNSCKEQSGKVDRPGSTSAKNSASAPSNLFLDSIKLESFVKVEKTEDSIKQLLYAFYKNRNYKYAWFSEAGVDKNLRSFWTLHNTYIHNFGDTAFVFDAFHHDIDLILNTDKVIDFSLQKKLQTELQLTCHFFVYLNNAYAGKADPAVLQWYIPRKKLDAVALLNSFLARNGRDIEDWEPVNQLYRRLRKEMLHYTEIEKQGGWNPIISDRLKTYRPGDSSNTIKQVKERLQIVSGGEKIETGRLYSPELLVPVKFAQKSFGLKENGIITPELIRELNVPVKERIGQIMINLERMRWLPKQPEGEFIAVNIPEFRLHLFNGEKKIFSIDIVVGQAAHNTVIFADKLQYIVFSPYWNVPPSIVRKEILPAIKRNGHYLMKNDMEQTGFAGGLPIIRQKPGGSNALGRVKFIFPNSYNIYFHDTPAKSLFGREARAFSHGCMRLAEPVKLATYLLRDQPEWTMQKIHDAMFSGVEKWVKLKQQDPVFITYFTAWVDSDSLLNFRKDIYSHDKQVAKTLFR